MTIHDHLPRTAAVLEAGIGENLHVGAQIAVSLDGKLIADGAVGIARAGVAMTADSLMVWFSSTKASTATAVMQQWERGRLDLDDPVVTHLPEFTGGGKDAITVRHLLTHTAGIRFADSIGTGTPTAGSGMVGTWEERSQRIWAAPVEEDWVPGRKAGYHPTAGMHVLAALVSRLDGRPYEQYVREEIFLPLEMTDSWVGMPGERYDEYGDRIGVMHATMGPTPRPLPNMDSRAAAESCIPGAGGRGPMHDLVKLYEMFLGRGTRGTTRLLSPQTVEAMTARHRVGMHDHTFNAPVDWGLGLAIDMWHYGGHCSPRTFGHGGALSSVGFADPEHVLAVAYVCNGMAGPKHPARMLAVSSAIYEDLGLVGPGTPPRERLLFAEGGA